MQNQFDEMIKIVITKRDINELIAFVQANYGIDFSNKRTFVEVRLRKYMSRYELETFPEFFRYICSDLTGIAVADFVSSLLINYTHFNREAMHFEFLRKEVLPGLKEKLKQQRTIYSWSAGCSTGEEPYTIAMTQQDFFNVSKEQWDTRILATDISTFALEKAKKASYPVEGIENLSRNWASYYFLRNKEDEAYVTVAPVIRNEVQFRKHNLVGTDFHFNHKFHFIFCRNVMIYFNPETKARLIQRLYDCLTEGGYLFIGMSETLDTKSTPFVYIKPSIYRKVVEHR